MRELHPPLDQLSDLPKPDYPRGSGDTPPVDYLALGITEADVPALVEVLTDPQFTEEDLNSDTVYVAVHAMRALGQLGSAEAVPPLFERLAQTDPEPDLTIREDLAWLCGQVGPELIPWLEERLGDPIVGTDSFLSEPRVMAADALITIADRHPETQPRVVEIFAERLRSPDDLDSGLCSMLVSGLTRYKAVEHMPLIEEVYRRDLIEISYAGSWEQVEHWMGLRKEKPDNIYGMNREAVEVLTGEKGRLQEVPKQATTKADKIARRKKWKKMRKKKK